MKKLVQSTRCILRTNLWLWLTVVLWAVPVMEAQAADWMKRSDKFYMEYSGSTPEHVTFHVLMCDLDYSNTYAKSEGTIYAESGSSIFYLMDIHYVSEGKDENPYGKVRARIDSREAAAWFTNGYNQQEQQLSFDTKDYLIRKWGGDNHYCTPAIDYYFPAAMAGKTWTFYYTFKHVDGPKYTMKLGTHTLSKTVGLEKFNTADFQYERTASDKIKFTVPAMPNDVKDKVKDIHKHVGTYDITFNYTLQDNSSKTVKESVSCEVGKKKTYEFTIPEEVGNFKMVDMSVEVTDALYDGVNYFWKETKTYNKTNIFQTVPVPKWEGMEYRQFDNAVDLMWDAYSASVINNMESCVPYIYRVETDKSGSILSGKSWSKRGSLSVIGSNQTQAYADKDVSQSTYYKYMIVNVPQEWIDNKSISSNDLNSPSDKVLHQLGYAISDVMFTAPEMTITNLQQDITETEKVRLFWEYTRVPVSASNVNFDIYRRQKGSKEWTLYGHTTADANPKAGAVTSFTDNDLPNNTVTFEYKVALSINDGKDVFESGVITAGLLSGTMVTEIKATKGDHESTVRVSWRAKQVGTDNTNFVLYRRYVGSNDDFLQIYTTTGHTDSYSYEDNTVQAGYCYEYKVEAYSGAQSNANNYQNSMSDVGFSQARGVISGNVTYGSGTAVDGVRLGLRSNSDDGTVAARGYSKRIDGVSTGIVWDSDAEVTDKVFGAKKDYTVQMFLRPDDNLSEGAVIGEVPYLGRFRLGQNTAEGYQLILEKFSEKTAEECKFSSIRHFRAICVNANETGDAYDSPVYGHVYSYVQGAMMNKEWTDEGYHTDVGWFVDVMAIVGWKDETNDNSLYLNRTNWKGTQYDTQLKVPASTYTLVTIQCQNGQLTITVGDKTSAILTETSVTKEYSTGEENNISQYPDMQIYQNGTNSFVYDMDSEYANEFAMRWVKKEKLPGNATYQATTAPLFNPFSLGGAKDIASDEEFKGNVTEVRVWDHVLTDKEKVKTKDRVLNGRENGLLLYWPMDEGLDHYVFDASFSNDVPNGRHATVGNNIISSTILPTEEQLARYGMTDENGEYIIRGIPFTGSGTTYTVTPTKGIHIFSPQSRNGFIGGGNLVLNGYDFKDQSAFTVKGKVTYQNTNIPADSIQFKIDGNLAQTKGGMVMTDANGEYELSVPIGNHLIEAFKDGHKLTTFPLDGTTYEFKQDEIINFFDQTLVNVTGRINGGFSDKDEPLGFKRSVNRLGTATLKLSLGKESQCSFNYIINDRGEGDFGTTDLPVETAKGTSINSTAYRAGGSHDDTYYIYITTDPETGEFSAMLPPLKYKVESIRFNVNKDADKDYNKLPVFAENLPFIDASQVKDSDLKKDSIEVNGEWRYYEYYAKMIRQYRADPTITVVQTGQKNGAFGESEITITNADNTEDKVPVISYTDNGYTYNYGKPLFLQKGRYEMSIDVSEDYVNIDTKEKFREVPSDAVISVSNTASLSTTVYAESCIIDGQEVAAGEPYNVLNIDIRPDKKGHVTYQWIGGWPNLGTGHLRNLNIGVKVDGHTTMWKAPDSQTEALDVILLGSLSTGTNFVTEGPQRVDYVLRRPPGSTSDATLVSDTIKAMNWQHRWATTSGNGDAVYLSAAPMWELSEGVCAGTVLMNHSKVKAVLNYTDTFNESWSDWEIEDSTYTYKLSEMVKTPNKLLYILNFDTYRADGGDTYIGRATNLQFGKGRWLNLYKQPDGTFKIGVKDAITLGESFGTIFVYPQSHIEEVLIPNLRMLIKDKLTVVNGNHWDASVAKRVEGKVMYYTKYKEGDPEWGRSNDDPRWSENDIKASGGFPSYKVVNGTNEDQVDMVSTYISSIKSWENAIAMNEEDKLKAFENSDYLAGNYSIAGGTSVTMTETISNKYIDGTKSEHDLAYNTTANIGLLLNEAGGYRTFKISDGSKDQVQTDTTTTYSRTVSWMLCDSDPRSALTVNVYKSPIGWGPVFRTLGGQTVNPYADATYTKYYKKNSLLDVATMRIEYPQLEVVGSTEITDVPTGGEARFKLQLTNLSETNSTCNYILEVADNSNPNGAALSMDGAALSNGYNGRNIKMSGGESILKTLVVKQGKRSVLDYKDILLVLRSEKDLSTHSDTVKLRVHFMPASAKVNMKVAHTVLNKPDKKEYGGFQVTVCDLDRQDAGLRGVRVQYRRKGTDSWSLAKQWSLKKYMQQGDEEMPDGSTFDTTVEFPEDGVYELRAQSFGTFAEAESSLVGTEVTYETDIIEVTQDLEGPKLLGMPSPEDGLLSYNNRNNMHVRFNEPLNENALSLTDNFIIEGYLNNASAKDLYHHDVAVQLNGDKIETEGSYLLSGSDIAFDVWFYRQGDGTILSMGTENNLLSLYTKDNGKLWTRVGDAEHVYPTEVTLPANKWLYMAFSYKKKSADDPENRVTMAYADADSESLQYIGKNLPVQELVGQGHLSIGGDGMKGMMHSLTLWSTEKSVTELHETRDETKTPYTPGLVGYWRMDEGHGNTLTDKARSRNMLMTDESWYINNRNLAAHIDGKEPLKVDVSRINTRPTDSYALEMWFRGDKVSSNDHAQLMSVLNGMSIGFYEGKLALTKSERTVNSGNEEKVSVKERVVLSDEKYADNEWHHLALSVHRGSSAIVYVDGKAVKTISESSIPAISGHYLVVGGEQTLLAADGSNGGGNGGVTNCLTGDVDEVRVWNASIVNDVIGEQRYQRLNSTYSGLVAYYPMEDIHRTETGTVTTDFSMKNFGNTENAEEKAEGNVTQSVNAPALLPGSNLMRLADRQFDFTASDDQIYFSFYDDVLPMMDGNDFQVTVKDIKDEHGNPSETAKWTFHADFAGFKWILGDVMYIEKKWDETKTVSTILYGDSNIGQSYELSGMPSWMTVTPSEGTITNLTQTIDITISPTVPVGKYTEYVYATNKLGIKRPLRIVLTVKGDEPDWSVNTSLYEGNMTLTGQLYVADKISEFTDSKVAAFDNLGRCRGVANPRYVSQLNAYYVDMIVYGASATDLSTGNRELTFKIYDASTGMTYPVVNITKPDGTTTTTLTYAPDAIIGSYDKPVIFRSTNQKQQALSLPRGWSWISVNVDPASRDIKDVLPKNSDDLTKIQNIKGKTAFATVRRSDATILGELQEMAPGNMYKIQTNAPITFDVYGAAIDVTATQQYIYPNYNWIGTLAPTVMSPEVAFADLNPKKGDMVKNRTTYATYNGTGQWIGTLQTIVPGEGYIYLSKDQEIKSFHYPRLENSSNAREMNFTMEEEVNTLSAHYEPGDDHQFPDNMNIIAVVQKDGEQLENAEVAAFINGECRGAVHFKDGYYFLTVMGSAADDVNNVVELRVFVDGEEYVVDNKQTFISDAVLGSLDEPYVLDLNATDIRLLNIDDDDDDDWWTLQGFKIGRKPTTPGVYVHHGKKVTVKRKAKY